MATPAPSSPGTRYEDWSLDDPAGQGVDAVRPIRDEIEQRVRGLLERELHGGADAWLPGTTHGEAE